MLNIAGLNRIVAVFDSGLVALWDPENMSQPPIKVQYVRVCRPAKVALSPLDSFFDFPALPLLWNPQLTKVHPCYFRCCSNDVESTWSLTSNPISPEIFVGSNHHDVFMFKLSSPNVQTTRQCIVEHDHNIPCIDVSPCGRFLASASIDSSVRITHIATQTQVGKLKLAQWGWCCLWIPKAQVKTIFASDRIPFLTTIFSSNLSVPTLENVDVRHYDLLKEDEAVHEAPPAKKRVVNMEGVSIDNFENIELVDEMDGEQLDGEDEDDIEMEVEAEENGFLEAEEDEEELVRPQYGLIGDLPDRGGDDEGIEPVNPFLDMPVSGKVEQVKRTQNEEVTVPEDLLLFVATFDEMYLFDSHLKMLNRVTKPLPRPSEEATLLNMVERFLIALWIPEWSVLIAGNQGLGSVMLATVRYNASVGQYEMIPELHLPRPHDVEESGDAHYILDGVSCYRIDEEGQEGVEPSMRKFFYRLHLRAGHLITYDLRLSEDGQVLAGPRVEGAESN